jgi:leucyl aminopeptidase
MDIATSIGNILEREADAIVLNLFEGVTELGGATGAANQALGGLIRNLISGGDFTGKFKQTAVLYPREGITSPRLILVGLGKQEDFSLNRVRLASASAAREAIQRGARTLASIIHGGGIGGLDIPDAAQATVEGAILGNYKFTSYKTGDDVPKSLDAFTLVEFDASKQTDAETGATTGQIIAESVCFARDLANTPGNDLPPAILADRVSEMASSVGLSCEIFDEQRIKDEGMGALSAVGQGSARPPRFIILEHKGNDPNATPIVFIGKGITFDTGGITLKGGDGMWDMKFDMCGSTAVIGAMQAVAQLNIPHRVIGLVAAAENMPDGNAYRPGDILHPLGGKTVEIRSTDAEGRLALIDAIAYAARYKPAAAIDLATLTGACVTALGNDASGLMGNNDNLVTQIHEAGNRTGEIAWHLPILDGHREQIKSDVADLKNTGGRPGGALTAGAFLEAYVQDFPWAHLDIAGTAWTGSAKSDTPIGSTGVGVRLLIDFLRHRT